MLHDDMNKAKSREKWFIVLCFYSMKILFLISVRTLLLWIVANPFLFHGKKEPINFELFIHVECARHSLGVTTRYCYRLRCRRAYLYVIGNRIQELNAAIASTEGDHIFVLIKK